MKTKYFQTKVERLLSLCRSKKLTLAAAESCTGGLLCGYLTSLPGASDVLERGFVTYSNRSKIENLGVSEELINEYGAVSLEVSSAMALGTIKNSMADIGVSITGIAGPDGGTSSKPVGLVYVSVATKRTPPISAKHFFKGDRAKVRNESLHSALDLLISVADEY